MKLHQVVALIKGRQARTTADITSVYHALQKPNLYSGLSRVYQPKEEDGDRFPSETAVVQRYVETDLLTVAEKITDLLDVVAQKDFANMNAVGTVKLADDTVIVQDAPVPFLLFALKQLESVNTIIQRLPVLDPSEEWTKDSNVGGYRTARPTLTTKTKKSPTVITKAPATEKHPAQTEIYMEDVVTGVWERTLFSGAVSQVRKDQLIRRLNHLTDAVKVAIEQANQEEAPPQHLGGAFFDYLLN